MNEGETAAGTPRIVSGAGSGAFTNPAGKKFTGARLIAIFRGTGKSGTLQLAQDGSPIWNASVSGGLDLGFPDHDVHESDPGPPPVSLDLVLSRVTAKVWIVGMEFDL